MKKLPVGISEFEKLRKNDYLYVDKTQHALELLESGGGYYFLSRPRRFGKSLFLSMLKSLFQGKKELFKDLYIYDKYEFEEFPVIYLNFTDNTGKDAQLKNSIRLNLDNVAKELDLDIEETGYLPNYFQKLITEAYSKTGKQVVILIDEYDKPITDHIDNLEKMQENRDLLRNIYSIIKGSDRFIKFCMLTGVSKFVKVSIFSGLNNLEDITLDHEFASICGYTHTELEENFTEYLKNVDKNKLAYWYDGYNFLGDQVYNPYDILLFFKKGNLYRNYWFESGTPSFLAKLMNHKQYFIPKLEGLKADDRLLSSFDIENIRVETLLFQAGYLTIKSVVDTIDDIEYVLDFPNYEVKNSFNKELFYIFSDLETVNYRAETRQALVTCDMDLFRENLYRLFAAIPYQTGKIHTYEGYYANIIFTHLMTLGLQVNCEERTNKGRIDLVIKTPDYVYLLEFKVGAENALQQIKRKGYHEKYADKTVILIGINFDEKERNITNFEWESIK